LFFFLAYITALSFVLFWDWVSLYSPCWPGT
jgi:hypothetical protein